MRAKTIFLGIVVMLLLGSAHSGSALGGTHLSPGDGNYPPYVYYPADGFPLACWFSFCIY